MQPLSKDWGFLFSEVRKSGFSGHIWDMERVGSNPIFATGRFIKLFGNFERGTN